MGSSRGFLPQLPKDLPERLKGGSRTQHYDGLGGRERQLFQPFTAQPISSLQSFKEKPTSSSQQAFTGKPVSISQPLTKFPSQPTIQSSSQPVTNKRKMPAANTKCSQMKTMDKFFGGFDTP